MKKVIFCVLHSFAGYITKEKTPEDIFSEVFSVLLVFAVF